MIQPDIDPSREPLVAQGILRVAQAARGVLGDVHRVLACSAVEESLSGLLRRPGTLCGSTEGSTARIRDTVLPAGTCGRCTGCRAARRAPRRGCIARSAGIRSWPRLVAAP